MAPLDSSTFSPFLAATIALSSLSWSMFDLSRKKLASDLEPLPVVAWLTTFQALAFLAFAPFDAWDVGGPQFSFLAYFWPFLASVALNLMASIWFVEAVALAPFSLAIPILSLTPVFSTAGGFALLNENITLKQSAGILLIVSATLAIGYFGARKSSSHATDASTNFESKQIRKGLLLMAVVALLFALTPVVDKMCLRSGLPASEHGFFQSVATALALWIWLRVKGGAIAFSRLQSRLLWFGAAIIFATSAVYFQFYSIQFLPVGIFEALKRSIGLLTALILGALMFKEPVTLLKAGLVVLMGVGIFVLLA